MAYRKVNSWRGLKDDLCGEIESGRLGVGDELPSVRSTVAKYGAHHSTVRKAFDELAAQGLITKRKGKCPVVVEGAVEKIRTAQMREFLEVELPNFRARMEALELNWEQLERLSAGLSGGS